MGPSEVKPSDHFKLRLSFCVKPTEVPSSTFTAEPGPVLRLRRDGSHPEKLSQELKEELDFLLSFIVVF